MGALTEAVKVIGEPVKGILVPPASKVGNTLASIWDITFGWIDHFDDKLKIKHEKDLQKFTEKLENEISKIPLDDKIEPKLSIAVPTLEASKYYIEDESLQSMFARLLANSMNKNTAQFIQTSFVEIIKQMSSLDAHNLLEISSGGNLPIIRIIQKRGNSGGYITKFPLIYWSPVSNVQSLQDNAVSLVNLNRLGLIEYGFDQKLADDNQYQRYINSPFYISQKQHDPNIDLQKGIVTATPFGGVFRRGCL